MKSLCLGLALLGLAGAAHAEPLTFDAALARADANAPSIAAKAEGVAAARSAAIPADALPDPKLRLGIDSFPVSGPTAGSFTDDDFTMTRIGVMQDIPNEGKREARADRARAMVSEAGAELEIERLAVRTAAAGAWVELYYLEKRLGALDGLDRDIRLIAQTLPGRVAANQAGAADITAPEAAALAVEDRRSELDAAIARARAELRRWVGDDAPVTLGGEPPHLEIRPDLLREALPNHVSLEHFAHREDRARADVAEEEASKRPDWSVELDYQHRDERFGDMISAGVTIDLPLFPGTRQDPRISARRFEANQVRIEREVAARSLSAELESTLADYDAARDRLARAQSRALPLAEQRLALATAAYRGGGGKLSEVLDARSGRTEAELRILELEGETALLATRLAVYFGGGRS